MNTNVKKYITQSLASSGIAILDSQHAYRLRPDIWPTTGNCSCDFAEAASVISAYLVLRGVDLYTITADDRFILVAAWNIVDLKTRLGWLGVRASTLEAADFADLRPKATPPIEESLLATTRRDRRRERIEQLATQEPPAHDCPRRTEILRARRELGVE